VRIRAGGGAFTDDLGNVWAADNYFNTGIAFATTSPIDGTVNDALYQSERYDAAGGSELTYSIPVTPGAYKVRLHFAEIYATAPGQRVFDVSIENQTAFAGLDIFAQAGAKNKALVKEYDVTVSDNILSITLIHKTENPKISAIEVVPGSSPAPLAKTAAASSAPAPAPDAATTAQPLHVVIESDSLAVDYDGDGMETMHFNGAASYTDEIGRTISRRRWDLDGSPLADADWIDIGIPKGDHVVGLTISDSNTPAQSFTGGKKIKVASPDLVPGALALYYAAANPAALLDAPLPKPDRAAVPAGLIQSPTAAPLSAPFLAVFQARVVLAAAGPYTFTARGGSATRLFLNGAPATGPVNLPAGPADVEVRFAISAADTDSLRVAYALGAAPAAAIPASQVYHDETYLLPVVNTFTAQGPAQGFPVDISGVGFFPRNQVQVMLGSQVLQGPEVTGTATSLHFNAPAGTGEMPGIIYTPNGSSLPFLLKYTAP
jgi:hypothetical protein